jgi:hypothetical protein
MMATHPSPAPAGAEGSVPYLHALAAALLRREWMACFAVCPACVGVQHSYELARSGGVLAVRGGGAGAWWYWFSWPERIAPAGDPGTAAEAVIRALGGPAGFLGRDGISAHDDKGHWR